MKRVDCRWCVNCARNECKLYGDDPVKAVRNCAFDGFRNYIQRKRKPKKKKERAN